MTSQPGTLGVVTPNHDDTCFHSATMSSNESTTYTRFTNALYERHSGATPAIPAYMIFDANYRQKYPFGPILQASQMPDRFVPKTYWDDGFIYKADSLEELADKLGVDKHISS